MKSSSVDALAAQVRGALQRGDGAQAERLCERIVELDATREEAWAYLAMRALDTGQAERANTYAERGLAALPRSALLAFHGGCALQAQRNYAAARAAFARAYANDAQFLTALFWQSASERALGEIDAALRTSVTALSTAERNGVLANLNALPAPVRQRVHEAMDFVQQARAVELDRAMNRFKQTHPGADITRIERALDTHLGRRAPPAAHPLQRPSFLHIDQLPAQAWFDAGDFPFLREIEARTDEIRAELLAVLADEAELVPYVDMPDHAPAAAHWRALNRSPRWSGYHFYRHGEVVTAHALACPRTFAALQALPLIRIPEHAPEALFSVLRPRTHIPPHTGVINGRLTVHLPLVVPENCGALRVGGEARGWAEGRCLVFDDSLVHEAWNNSDHTRVVLIFDIWDPRLSEAERAAMALGIAEIGRFNRHYGAHDAFAEP
jgi:aspartate beta-hydroxylase